MLGFRHAAELQDERSIRAKQLRVLEAKTRVQTVAVREMTDQSRLGSYRRVRVPR